MQTLIFTLTGDQSDLDFIRARCEGALLDLIDEYEQNLDEKVELNWEWKD